MIKDYVCVAVGIVGGFIAKCFGGWDESLFALVLFMCIDYITGIMVAGVFHASTKSESGALESNAGWKGLCRKCVTLFFVIVAHELDVVMHTNYIRDAVIIGFIANEVISITENAGLMGVPLPKIIIKSIEVLKHKYDEKSN